MIDQANPIDPRPWATVTDSAGKSWQMRITLALAMSLRADKILDLLGTDSAPVAMQVAGDPVKLCEVAVAICGQTGNAEQFLASFDGDTFQDLFDATVEAMIDFFPKGRREALMALWTRQRRTRQTAESQVMPRLSQSGAMDAIDREADRALAEFDKRLAELGEIRS